MKRKILILMLCVVVVVGVLLFIFFRASAQDKSLRDILGIAPDTTSETATALIDLSHNVAVSSDQLAKNAVIIKDAQVLIGKAEATYLVAGWLHTSAQTEAFVTAQKTLPDGSPVPTKWTTDSWYRLNDKGMVLQAVTIQDTGNPATSQTSIYKDGEWTNLNLGTSDSQASYKFTFDGGFLSAAQTFNQINTLTSEEASIQGQDAVVYTVTNLYVESVSFGKEQGVQYTGGAVKYYFDRKTGQELQSETYYIRQDGTLELFERNSNMTTEKVDRLPNSFAGYFNGK